MSRPAEGIEKFFSQRYNREAIYLPSGRLALYIAFKEFLRAGDRLLMSPVDDDVVFFTVLAAGLVPVIGPLDPRTGNLDPGGLDETTWKSLRRMTNRRHPRPDDRWVKSAAGDLSRFEDAARRSTRARGLKVGEFSSIAASATSTPTGSVGVDL
jgi:hypothetical protein